MSLKYEPILNDTSESECIRVKKYLIEFLEELRRINKNKNKNTLDLVQEIKCKEQDPIKIEVTKISRLKVSEIIFLNFRPSVSLLFVQNTNKFLIMIKINKRNAKNKKQKA